MKSTAWEISSVLNLLQIRHDALHPALARSHRSPFSRSKNIAAGEPGSQTTGLGAEAKESATQADQIGPLLLDRSQSSMVGLEKFAPPGETRNGCGVASSRVSSL